MDIAVDYCWREHKSARRSITHEGTLVVSTPEVNEDVAPVAARYVSSRGAERTIRWWGGQLWDVGWLSGASEEVIASRLATVVRSGETILFDSEPAVVAALRWWASEHLIVRGREPILYRRAVEPLIVVTGNGQMEPCWTAPLVWQQHYDSVWSCLAYGDAVARARELGGAGPWLAEPEVFLPKVFKRDAVAEERTALWESASLALGGALDQLRETAAAFQSSAMKWARSDIGMLAMLVDLRVALDSARDVVKFRYDAAVSADSPVGDRSVDLGLADVAGW
jgi:hypothetical protein